MSKQKNFPSYEEAKKLVVAKGINSQTEYNTIYKVLGLPSTPSQYYNGKGWTNWYDFLGNEKMVYPSYEDAKKIVMSNGIKTQYEYKPIFKVLGLPSHPDKYYYGKGWTNWYDFLGNEKIAYPSYEEAKKIVMSNGIKTQYEYKPIFKVLGLPSHPDRYYYGKGWTNWYDFLGNEKIAYPSYEETKKIVKNNDIKTKKEYLSVCNELGLPSYPDYSYKGKGWSNWYDLLGNEKIAYPSYEEAKKIVLDNNICTPREYRTICNKLGLPSHPDYTYKSTGWSCWTEFFDKEKKAYPSCEEAKRMVFENGVKSCAEYKDICNDLGLPTAPSTFYKNKGWIDWYDFLGKSKPISSSARKTKVYTTLSISPVLLEDDAPLQIVYMLASQIDKKLANEIEELLHTASCEDRLNMVKEQLKSLKADAESMSVSPRESAIGELSAMESMMDVFEDTLDSLPEDTTEYLNNIIKNYYHNATNRALIAEYDD